ncbi:MAG: zinc ABC transporter solute-binding protein [Candidatus Firestonebacteria bacterium]|nr:zinc ABC transporter solute-binding protein [Candidatus Firestonebacteria bacterium]
MLIYARVWLTGILLILSLAPASGASEVLPVTVTILPQKYLVDRIGGTRVSVQVLVPPGKSHETYEPTPRQVADLAQGKIFFRIGLPLENALLPKLQRASGAVTVVDMGQGIARRYLEKENAAFEAAHDHAAPTTVGSPDPHFWLSPVLAQREAATVLSALVAQDPAGKAYYEERCQALLADLQDLHVYLTRVLAPLRGSVLFVYHPAYGYFADAYGLRQLAVEIEGKEPEPRQLTRFIKLAKQHRVRVIFVQPQFSRVLAGTIAKEMGIATAIADPLAEDWADNLLRVTGVLCGK